MKRRPPGPDVSLAIAAVPLAGGIAVAVIVLGVSGTGLGLLAAVLAVCAGAFLGVRWSDAVSDGDRNQRDPRKYRSTHD